MRWVRLEQVKKARRRDVPHPHLAFDNSTTGRDENVVNRAVKMEFLDVQVNSINPGILDLVMVDIPRISRTLMRPTACNWLVILVTANPPGLSPAARWYWPR